MEQQTVTLTEDNENMIKILSELLNHKKDLQIMINVPGMKIHSDLPVMETEPKKRDLEKDVTEMIHEIERGERKITPDNLAEFKGVLFK